VTIIEERGSTPRNAGSKMVVSAKQTFDTIGGGHLEYKAMHIARQMLASGKQDTHLERFSLGASLGQCCGGATVLLFEPMGQVQAQIAVFGAGHVGRAWCRCSPACRAGYAGSIRGKRNSPTRSPRRA
jgi:xanthine dehydrogenase accessory factor